MKNIGSIHLITADHSIFKKLAHDRFIRCDSTVINIGIGVSVFTRHQDQARPTVLHRTADMDNTFRDKIENSIRSSGVYVRIR